MICSTGYAFFPASCHKQGIQCGSVSNFFLIFLSNSGIYCFFGQRCICPQKNYLRKAKAVKLSLENGDENGDENGFHSFALALDLSSAACNDQSS